MADGVFPFPLPEQSVATDRPVRFKTADVAMPCSQRPEETGAPCAINHGTDVAHWD